MATLQQFYGLDLATLQTMRTQFTEAIISVATAGQSYSIGGRTFTRASLSELNSTLAAINAAIDFRSGKTRTVTLPAFRRSY
jgi:hypothetical protein